MDMARASLMMIGAGSESPRSNCLKADDQPKPSRSWALPRALELCGTLALPGEGRLATGYAGEPTRHSWRVLWRQLRIACRAFNVLYLTACPQNRISLMGGHGLG